MGTNRLISLSVCLLLLVPLAAMAAQHDKDKSATGLNLPPKLQKALVDEMVAINKGVAVLPEAIVKAEWKVIAETGEMIEQSYILKKRLSDAEREELMHALPRSFQYLDGRFHEHAGKLVHAAENRDGELVRFYFSKMLDSCAGCHAVYAKHRFEGYADKHEAMHKH